jgi:hypothetical protein
MLVPAQIPVHRCPVRQRPYLQPVAVIGTLVEPPLQRLLAQIPDLIPAPQPCLFRPHQQVVQRAQAYPTALTDLAVAHSKFVA